MRWAVVPMVWNTDAQMLVLIVAEFVPQQTLKRVVLHTIRGKQPQNFSATSRNYLGAKNPCLWGELPNGGL